MIDLGGPQNESIKHLWKKQVNQIKQDPKRDKVKYKAYHNRIPR
jgi:hypothetical protein